MLASVFFKTRPHYFLSISLLSGTTRCPKLILYLPCPSSGFNHFSKASWWFLLVENGN